MAGNYDASQLPPVTPSPPQPQPPLAWPSTEEDDGAEFSAQLVLLLNTPQEQTITALFPPSEPPAAAGDGGRGGVVPAQVMASDSAGDSCAVLPEPTVDGSGDGDSGSIPPVPMMDGAGDVVPPAPKMDGAGDSDSGSVPPMIGAGEGDSGGVVPARTMTEPEKLTILDQGPSETSEQQLLTRQQNMTDANCDPRRSQPPSTSSSSSVADEDDLAEEDNYRWNGHGWNPAQHEGKRLHRQRYTCMARDFPAVREVYSSSKRRPGRYVKVILKVTHSLDPPEKRNVRSAARILRRNQIAITNVSSQDMASSSSVPNANTRNMEGGELEQCFLQNPREGPMEIVDEITEDDVPDDKYTWNLLEEKFMKGSQYPRKYYRCKQQNCNMHKKVYRLDSDPTVVRAIQEGSHSHEGNDVTPSNNHAELGPNDMLRVDDIFIKTPNFAYDSQQNDNIGASG